MKALIQRVLSSKLEINKKEYSKIERGFLVLLGITHDDTEEDMKALAEKIVKLRIFEDENEKMNLSIKDVGGALHIVSQFRLYADCHHGNRPSFINAAKPEYANELYEKFIKYCREELEMSVETGSFGADMQITLTNDGPVTIMLECKDGKIL